MNTAVIEHTKLGRGFRLNIGRTTTPCTNVDQVENADHVKSEITPSTSRDVANRQIIGLVLTCRFQTVSEVPY